MLSRLQPSIWSCTRKVLALALLVTENTQQTSPVVGNRGHWILTFHYLISCGQGLLVILTSAEVCPGVSMISMSVFFLKYFSVHTSLPSLAFFYFYWLNLSLYLTFSFILAYYFFYLLSSSYLLQSFLIIFIPACQGTWWKATCTELGCC